MGDRELVGRTWRKNLQGNFMYALRNNDPRKEPNTSRTDDLNIALFLPSARSVFIINVAYKAESISFYLINVNNCFYPSIPKTMHRGVQISLCNCIVKALKIFNKNS